MMEIVCIYDDIISDEYISIIQYSKSDFLNSLKTAMPIINMVYKKKKGWKP
jgi:hypothetical protein